MSLWKRFPNLNVIPAQAGIHASLPKMLLCRTISTIARADLPQSMKIPCVYIVASKRNGVLYVGVTSDLEGRMSEHDQALIEGFSKRHGTQQLVYYECHDSMDEAIRREKRAWKVRLIESVNPEWRNLFDPSTGEVAECPADRALLLETCVDPGLRRDDGMGSEAWWRDDD